MPSILAQFDSPPLSPEASQPIDIPGKTPEACDQIPATNSSDPMSHTPPDTIADSSDSQGTDSDTITGESKEMEKNAGKNNLEEPELPPSECELEVIAEKKCFEAAERKRIFTEEKSRKAIEGREEELARIRHLNTNARNQVEAPNYNNTIEKLTEMTKYWVQSAYNAGECPLQHAICFGQEKGERVTATLAQIHALMPQRWQWAFRQSRYQTSGSEAWLDENIMNVLVHLATRNHPNHGNVFGISLASLINHDMDEFYKSEHGMVYTRHLVNNVLPNRTSYPAETRVFTFPENTEKIVWFWNYLGDHWTTVETCLNSSPEPWEHKLFNSLEAWGRPKGNWSRHERKQIHSVLDDIEEVIQELSGFPRPTDTKYLKKGASPEQDNFEDCGVFAAYNAICLLRNDPIDYDSDAVDLRRRFLDLILQELRPKFGPLSDFYQFEEEASVEVAPTEGEHSDGSQATDSPRRDDSPVQHEKDMSSSPPDLVDMIFNIEAFDSESEGSAGGIYATGKRSLSPEAINITIYTPSSSPSPAHTSLIESLSSDTVDITAALMSKLTENAGNSVLPNSDKERVIENDPFVHSPKRLRRSLCRSPPRNCGNPRSNRVSPSRSIRSISLEANETDMMGFSRPSDIKTRSSSSPPTYDTFLPPHTQSPEGNIRTQPPVHTISLMQSPAAMHDWHEIFPAESMGLTKYMQRISDLDALVEHGKLSEGYIQILRTAEVDVRERRLYHLIEAFKASK